jgi:hypothetical protein
MKHTSRNTSFGQNSGRRDAFDSNTSRSETAQNTKQTAKLESKSKKSSFKKSFKLNQIRTVTRANRDLLVNINMFLLTNSELKGLFWSVKSVDYNSNLKTLKICIDTIDNKLGTTLEKMRKVARFLGEDMYQKDLLTITPRVYFSVQKEDTLMDKLAKIEFENKLFEQITKNAESKEGVGLLSV